VEIAFAIANGRAIVSVREIASARPIVTARGIATVRATVSVRPIAGVRTIGDVRPISSVRQTAKAHRPAGLARRGHPIANVAAIADVRRISSVGPIKNVRQTAKAPRRAGLGHRGRHRGGHHHRVRHPVGRHLAVRPPGTHRRGMRHRAVRPRAARRTDRHGRRVLLLTNGRRRDARLRKDGRHRNADRSIGARLIVRDRIVLDRTGRDLMHRDPTARRLTARRLTVRGPTGRDRTAPGPIVLDRTGLDRTDRIGRAPALGPSRVGPGRSSRAAAAARKVAKGSHAMLVHIVLFRPKASLSSSEQRALISSIEQAATNIPTIRRFRVGRALPDPPAYQLQGFPDMPYVAILEFDDRAALEDYLEHHAHGELGRRFNEGAEAALIYDYEVTDASAARSLM